MKKAKRLLAFLLVAVFAANFGLVQPAFAAQIDEYDPYEKRIIETVTMDGVTYDFHLSYQNGNRTITITEASNPVPTPLLGHRCRSSQEITGYPTPFSTSNHYLWICASASFSLSNPNIAA